MQGKKHTSHINVTHMFSPGIFQVKCLTNGRSFFGQAEMLLPEMEKFYRRLEDGICESRELLADVQKYGIADFEFIIIYFYVSNEEERKCLLEEEKNKWPRHLLYLN